MRQQGQQEFDLRGVLEKKHIKTGDANQSFTGFNGHFKIFSQRHQMCTALLLRLATEIDFAVGPAHLPVLETCIAVIPQQIVLESYHKGVLVLQSFPGLPHM